MRSATSSASSSNAAVNEPTPPLMSALRSVETTFLLSLLILLPPISSANLPTSAAETVTLPFVFSESSANAAATLESEAISLAVGGSCLLMPKLLSLAFNLVIASAALPFS